MQPIDNHLPIEAVLPELKRELAENRNAVLIAAPGAGKTTRVPLALLGEPWLSGLKIIMLEPRRLAARSAAKYMASALGEEVGGTVGYRVRMDTKVTPRTRVEVVTEGVLTRMLQDDPSLEGVGLVIFDEFHERSLQADLGLALTLQSQALLRDDLKLLVMSATLEAQPVAKLLGDAPVVVSEGRAYPVETLYRPRSAGKYLDESVANVVIDALREHEGDVLVFLPGMGEIRATLSKLRGMLTGMSGVHILPLHGSLPFEEQDKAIAPAKPGERKVVLATSVAETSLTVDGITVVVDAGLMRVSRFSPRTGMSRLETVPVSKASADQRRGRAGRLQPGTCYRLWSREEQDRLAPSSAPEIMEADLASLLLELLVWGAGDPAELGWLNPPPAPALQQARELLTQLGALDASGAITAHGRRMAELGAHPRLAHMLLRAMPLGLGATACELAVLLTQRESGQKGGAMDRSDLRFLLEALHGAGPLALDEGARRRLLDEVGRLKRELGASKASSDANACGLLLAFAYPDRIARQRENGKYLLNGGRGATFVRGADSLLGREEWIVIADVDDAGPDSTIRMAAPIAYAQLEEHHKDAFTQETDVYWDKESQSVRARARKRIGAIVLEEVPMHKPPAPLVTQALLQGIRAEGLALLPWTKAARQYQERVVFVRHHDASWPDLSDEALLAELTTWLAPYAEGVRTRADLQRLNVKELLESMLTWEQRRQLDSYAPTHWSVPSGSRLPIDYSDMDAPILAVRLQELFGLPDTPRIAGGRVALTLHLLSPAQRPVQVTRDLASFWRSAYFEVRKDLKGRYPKHYWPDDPLEAQATRRAKPPGQ